MKIENFIETSVEHFHLSPELFGRISLSVIEAVNNAVLYGNRRDVRKTVTVSAEKFGKRFRVVVHDEGDGFDYTNIPDPTVPDPVMEKRRRGLFLMKSLSDDLFFENNGASVILIFNLK